MEINNKDIIIDILKLFSDMNKNNTENVNLDIEKINAATDISEGSIQILKEGIQHVENLNKELLISVIDKIVVFSDIDKLYLKLYVKLSEPPNKDTIKSILDNSNLEQFPSNEQYVLYSHISRHLIILGDAELLDYTINKLEGLNQG